MLAIRPLILTRISPQRPSAASGLYWTGGPRIDNLELGRPRWFHGGFDASRGERCSAATFCDWLWAARPHWAAARWDAAPGGCSTAALPTKPDRSLALNFPPPAFSVVPVVGDGHWIWNEPPADGVGYLEPRSYSLKIGIELEAIGDADSVLATTPVPVAHPEQKIEDVHVETSGCEATLRELAPGMGQLLLSAESIAQGSVASAIAHYTLTLCKQFHKYERDQFPAQQKPPADIRKAYLQDSPGIQTSTKQVRSLAAELSEGVSHPWDKARRFAEWIPKNIRPQIGSYTSVTAALERRLGDCEEMSAVFVALCRSIGIPARLVWVPNHNWSEFYLTDSDGQAHWIPAHTACYFWFGWTGAHELVIQKGDRVLCAEQHKRVRLLEDWMQWGGRKPALPLRRRADATTPFARRRRRPRSSHQGRQRRMESGRRSRARPICAAVNGPPHDQAS